MGTEGHHGDRGVPWGQRGTMGTEGYHGDREVQWGQRGTMGTLVSITANTPEV